MKPRLKNLILVNQKKIKMTETLGDDMVDKSTDLFSEKEQQLTTESDSADQVLYHDSGYNRNKTLIAKYVHRIIKDFPTATERYYDIRFVSAANKKSYFGEVGDQCLMFHSNRICLLTLAPTHPVIQEGKKIDKIEFTFEGKEKIDRLANQIHGKRKKGGQKLQKYAPICAIFCSDGVKYVVTACISSRLLEINQAIQKNSNLITSRPLSTGFIAIVQPNDWKNLDSIKSNFPKLGQDIQSIVEDDAYE